MEQNRLHLYQTLFEDDVTDLTYVEFKKKYMSSESQFVSLYNDLISRKDPEGTVYYNETIEKFFQKYACDLSSIKYSNHCIQEGFPKCVSAKGTAQTELFGFGRKFIKYRTTLSRDWLGDKPEIKLYQSSDGTTGEFLVASGPKTNTKGTYTCNNYQLVLNEPTGVSNSGTQQQTQQQQTQQQQTQQQQTQQQTQQQQRPTSSVTIIKKDEKNFKVAGSDAIIF